MGRTTTDLAGRRFGRLEVLERAPDKTGHAMWLCRCDCGNTTIPRGVNLASGATRSCGCIHREMMVERNTGAAPEPLSLGRPPIAPKPRATRRSPARKAAYHAWYAARRRCTNPDDPAWSRYGGRGITMCERWASFGNFLADMGERPDGMSLERRDNELGYSPGNCIWADARAQARNRRGVKLTPETLIELLRLNHSGIPTEQVAQRVGLSYKTTTLAIWIADTLALTQGDPSAR